MKPDTGGTPIRYLALATDYDGTLAEDGRVHPATVLALERLRASRRRLLMVTGREIPDLLSVCPEVTLFDLIVAENGALLYDPADGRETLLAEPPPAQLVAALELRGVQPISMGRAIIATWTPHEVAVLEVIRDLGLEHEIIFNKGAVMVLPDGITKATGLRAALQALKLPAESVVGVGDAENDHSFLDLCGCAVAVANAIPAIQRRADLVTTGARGSGVTELIDRLLADDLAS